jgi:hypothetical protein
MIQSFQEENTFSLASFSEFIEENRKRFDGHNKNFLCLLVHVSFFFWILFEFANQIIGEVDVGLDHDFLKIFKANKIIWGVDVKL